VVVVSRVFDLAWSLHGLVIKDPTHTVEQLGKRKKIIYTYRAELFWNFPYDEGPV
jgi:hypothetical protein